MSIEWKAVDNYEGLYEVSNSGNIRRRGKILKPAISNRGYFRISLSKNNVKKDVLLHRIVARAFLGQCPNGLEVNHEDGNKKNNVARNLRYVTSNENKIHAYRNGLASIWNKGKKMSKSFRATCKETHKESIKKAIFASPSNKKGYIQNRSKS